MAVNTRFATGVHTLVILALEPSGLLTSDEIAERLNSNPVVIRRVLARLRQAGLIASQKGPNGGSKLGKPAKAIGLGQVYRALEPAPLFKVSPAQDGKLGTSLERVFAEARTALEEELDGSTIGQLAKKAAKGRK
ncbi:MAG TPA: Rrf2 family transcriptional regulator [Acidisarcina sp.]